MIDVAGLTRRYGRKTAVDDLTFTVPSGAVTGLLGPNGAGKSTTMRMIVGLDRPTSGAATIDGADFRTTRHPLRTLGVLLDPTAIHRGRTGRTHLRALAASNGISTARADEMLAFAGLADAGNRRIGQYSLGMRQRLGLAAALLGEPGTLILDEPVNGLDPDGVHWVRTVIRAHADAGGTVLVSSHLMSEMALTADRVVVIGRGRLVTEGSMADVVARATGTSVLVRSPRLPDLAEELTRAGASPTASGDDALVVSGMDAAAIGELAARSGIALHELTPQRGSLEEAFLALTAEDREFTAGAHREEHAS